MDGFYWVIPGVLAGSPRPGGASGADLAAELAWLRLQGVRAVLSLTELPLDSADLDGGEFVSLHLPITDMTAPSPAQLAEALSFIDQQRALDLPVVVHC